jgi:N-acetylglucosaminyldiphosphoundecaprenol N-acetyl-beta-D-mannosaminyltransferase
MAEPKDQAIPYQSNQPARVNVIGTGISAVNMVQTLDSIERVIVGGGPGFVCCAAVHSVLDAHRDPGLREAFNRSLLTTPDGMPLVWLCRMTGIRSTKRVYGPDLMRAACAFGERRGWKHFFLGGSPPTLQALSHALQATHPGIKIVGCLSPAYPDPSIAQIDRQVVEVINGTEPDIVWVGLGTGKQERWMARHLGAVEAPLMIGVGAAFDFLAGTKRQAPPLVRRAGMEWLFRLSTEPRRLWRRYGQYPLFGWLLLLQALGIRAYPLIGGRNEDMGALESDQAPVADMTSDSDPS